MFFCPQCQNKFNITRTPGQSAQTGGGLKPVELIEKILNEGELERSDVAGIDPEKFAKVREFQQLTTSDKEIVLNKIHEMLPKKSVTPPPQPESNVAYFVCENCDYYTTIDPGVMIFSQVYDDANQMILMEDYKYICDDPTLPRTRDYTCQNRECPTKSNRRGPKEAVIKRVPGGYRLVYGCCICRHTWLME